MADFDAAIPVVLQHEDPGLTGAVEVDTGGMTRWGISARSYPYLDIRNLSLDDAKAIYRRDFWTPIQGDAIADQHCATKLLDMAVNMGIGTAIKLAQQAVGVAEDGVVGPLTLAALNAADPQVVLADLRHLSAERYEAIIASDPAVYGQYRENWLARAAD